MIRVEPQIVTWFISIIALCVSIYIGTSNSKHSDKSEISERIKEAEKKAAEMATINVKLDDIGKDTKDIKYDVTTVKATQVSQGKEIERVHSSVKSAHYRIDYLASKLNVEIPRDLSEREECKNEN